MAFEHCRVKVISLNGDLTAMQGKRKIILDHDRKLGDGLE